MAVTVGPPRDEGDWEAFTRLEGQTFATSPEETQAYMQAVRGDAIARFAVDDDKVLAGALAFPCHQWFGGRAVTSGAVASVCVAPEARGSGHGRAVMWALADAMREAGLAVASLWPSAPQYYRGLGWEVAGTVSRMSARGEGLRRQFPPTGSPVRNPATDEVAALVDEVSRNWSGPIRRPEWWWRWRMPDEVPDRTFRFGWREGDRLTGFLSYRLDTRTIRGWGHDALVTGFWVSSVDALAGLLGIVAGERPLSPTIAFQYGVIPETGALRLALPDDIQLTDHNTWMLRVLDPVAAFTQAGWPAEIRGQVELEVATMGSEPRKLVVGFEDGVATVASGGAGHVRMSSGGFAAWFAGHVQASEAALLGSAGGPAADLRFMDVLTADRRPWLPDMF